MVKKINLNAIRIDGGTQPRERIDMDAVSDYAEAVRTGIEFPPIIVFYDGAEHWLADGFHRWHAHKQAGKASIAADVRAGSLDDAKLFASGSNGDHGLRRTNADKRLAVLMALAVKSAADWSDTKLANHCYVSVPFVSAIRRPEVAAKQQENRISSVERAVLDRNPITVSTTPPAPAKTPAASAHAPAATPDDDQIAEAQHTITELAEENEQLRDKLAVGSLMESDEAKNQTTETLRELRALVKTLEAENAALKVSRDTYQREATEAKKSAIYWRKQAEKAAKDAA